MMNKLKNSAGFTLAEMLITMLILVIVAGIVAGGLPVAVTAYSRAVDAANAHVLISTTVNALRAELSTARDVHFNEVGELIYVSTATESKTKLYTEEKDHKKQILVQDFLRFDETGPQTQGEEEIKPRELITKSAAAKSLEAAYESVEWADTDETVLVFHDLKVKKDDTTVTSIDKLYIRCLGVGLTERADSA